MEKKRLFIILGSMAFGTAMVSAVETFHFSAPQKIASSLVVKSPIAIQQAQPRIPTAQEMKPPPATPFPVQKSLVRAASKSAVPAHSTAQKPKATAAPASAPENIAHVQREISKAPALQVLAREPINPAKNEITRSLASQENSPIAPPQIPAANPSLAQPEPIAITPTMPEAPIAHAEVAEQTIAELEEPLAPSSPLISESAPPGPPKAMAAVPTSDSSSPIKVEPSLAEPATSKTLLIAQIDLPEPSNSPVPTPEPDPAPAPQVETEDSTEQELFIKPKVGYGGKYVSLKQTGAFGGVEGSTMSMNALSVEAKLSYGEWSLLTAFEKFSMSFNTDTTNPSLRESKEFKTLSIKPGYGHYFAGIKASTAPLVHASGTTLRWAEVTTLSAVLGMRFEKIFAGRRRKPFLLGFEIEGSYPLSASGNGGQSLSSSSGYGLSLKGNAEKLVIRAGDDFLVKLGMEANASYDYLSTKGAWSGSSGTATRSILEVGSRLYLGIDF